MARGEVVITSTAPALRVQALLGADGAKVTAGYGGWTVVSRPRRVGLTQWDGRDPYQMSVQLVIDQFANEGSIESTCTALERMALPPRERATPPEIRVSGPVPHKDLSWVINGIEWGQAWRRNDGARIRQEVTLQLLRYIGEDRVEFRTAAERARANGSTGTKAPAQRTYVVKAGDTLSGIAAKMYGDASKWKRIADANGIRDPKNLKIGQRLRIP